VNASDKSSKKYETVKRLIRQYIDDNGLKSGTRLPTERALTTHFGVSRPTVTRALNDLVVEGLIVRKVGSGSYVADSRQFRQIKTLGLLVPGLGRGEIFEPICAKIAEMSAAKGLTLSWGGSSTEGHHRDELVQIAEKFISQKVDGVFFQPLELHPGSEGTNESVARLLAENNVPVVMLDADYLPFPDCSQFDLVGIDNIRAGFIATRHLLNQGADRVDFVVRPFTAKSAILRKNGYRLALIEHNISPRPFWEHSINTEDVDSCGRLLESGATDIVCVSDEAAASLILSLEKLGVSVPDEIRLVGFDDLKYAHLLRVPLTTMRQPCAKIGELAFETMLSRIRKPDLPGRKIFIDAELVKRRSSGHL
jgi:DNA-binding LacI/PurR family transcriptional regulator